METKHMTAALRVKASGPEGSVQALFSVYNVRDSTNDVVLPGAFQAGQQIPLSAWGHRWEDLPAGRGVIRDTPEGAVFDGQFFMETAAGRETYLTVKALSQPPSIQEWSFGFSVDEADYGEFEGHQVRFLRKLTTFEASPVLIGANRQTATLAIKSGRRVDGRAEMKRFRELGAELVLDGLLEMSDVIPVRRR